MWSYYCDDTAEYPSNTRCWLLRGVNTSGVRSGLPVVRLDTIQM